MLMPVTAMNKHGHLMTAQHNIRRYLPDPGAQPKSVAESMQGFTGENFRSGVTGPYTGHHPATGFPVNDVCHLFTFS